MRIRSLPLMIILWMVYNGLIVAGQAPESLGEVLFHLPLPSNAVWSVTAGDLFVFAGVLFLYVEILKAARSTPSSILDHTLSTLVFVLFLIEFLIAPQAGNSIFFTLTLMALIDVVAGFSVTIVAARRDIGLSNHLEL